jgi:uncharacterized protein
MIKNCQKMQLKTILIFFCSTVVCTSLYAQANSKYISYIKNYQKNYVRNHEVVKGSNKKKFSFYPINESLNIKCLFKNSSDTNIVVMKTTGTQIPLKDFVRYGTIHFTINNVDLTLTVFQSKTASSPQYANYLFIPFTDATTGDSTYGSGRYIDIMTYAIKNDSVTIDFNKAYNPYCAYTTGYNCPIPPKENNLPIAITAGEKIFGKLTK